MSRKATFALIALNVLLAAPVSAQGLKNAGKNLGLTAQKAGADGNKNIEDVVGTGIRTALTLVGIIFLALMVYAGYLWMTARGEETQIDKAKSIISSSIIGLGLVMGAYAITALVTAKFGG